MFYATLGLLQTMSIIPKKHSGVLSVFDKEFVMKGVFPKDLSRDFHRAFDLRQTSDYQVMNPVTVSEAQDILARARKFVETVGKYLA